MDKVISSPGRLIFVRVPEGSKPHQYIERVMSDQGINAAWINGLGGFKWARVGYLDPSAWRYHTIDVEAKDSMVLEVASLTGNSVRGPDGSYYTHIHVVLGRSPGENFAGHLIDAIVEPFLEVAIIEISGGVDSLRNILSHRWRRGR